MLLEMAEEISRETPNAWDSLIQSRVKVVKTNKQKKNKQQLGSNARVTSISEELQE